MNRIVNAVVAAAILLGPLVMLIGWPAAPQKETRSAHPTAAAVAPLDKR